MLARFWFAIPLAFTAMGAIAVALLVRRLWP
jgi:hypothetical protein